MLESLFNKVTGTQACNFIKERLQHRSFPMKLAKFLRIPFLRTPPVAASVFSEYVFLQNTSGRLFLNLFGLNIGN